MKITRYAFIDGACTLLAMLAGGPACAQSLTTLYTFTGAGDGANPVSGLLAGPDGSFFGTTTAGSGTIFQLSPPAPGQTAWIFTTLYTFSGGADGSYPEYLIKDRSGALYGITNAGGIFNGNCAFGGTDYGCGTVFKLKPPSQGRSGWTLATIYAFTGGADSGAPTGGVVMNGSGNLLGFTAGIYQCGNGQCGSAYEISPPAHGKAAWNLTTLYNFTGGMDGGYTGLFGLPLLDPSGKVFGIAGYGGTLQGHDCALVGGCGVVFQLTPPAQGGTAWTDQTLLTFAGRNGATPLDGLSEDEAGNLYGETNLGGHLQDCRPGKRQPNGCGVIYRLSPPAPGSSAWTDTVLHRFTNGTDGGYPYAPPFLTHKKIFATTSGDEVTSFGSIDELLSPRKPGGDVRVRTRFSFDSDANGGSPTGALVERAGVIYGTTFGTGTGPAALGTVFSFKP